MSAWGTVVRAGVAGRRTQTLVIGLATMMAVAASILGGSLLAVSGAPFDDAFAARRGAHLSVRFDADRVSAGRLARTGGAEGVSEAAGPFRTATVTPKSGRTGPGWPMTVVGRATATGGGVDEVAVLDGRWPVRAGEIALSADTSLVPVIGMKVTFPGLPGAPALKVVGVARSVTRTADAWVVPAQVPALTGPGDGGYQMLYRFTAADTPARITAGSRAVAEALPPGAVAGEQSWLTVRRSAARDTALYVPFLIAFGALGLAMSVLVVGNVVAAAVGTGTRRIGVLKAIGLTPSQVVRAYMGQAAVPAVVGTAVGVLAGHLLAVPVLARTAEVYGTSSLAVAPWVDLAVITGVLGLVTVTAWASALRAGRLRTVDALAVGRAAPAGHARWAARLSARLPLPGPVALGLVRPFARPARSLAMGTAILFGTVAITFTVGMGSSLAEVMRARAHDAADVVVSAPPHPPGAGSAPGPATAARTAGAIDATSGTGKYYTSATVRATVAGLAGTVGVTAFTGDASWGGWTMVSGRWIEAPGEAVVPTAFLTSTGTRVGDTVTVDGMAEPVRVRIVGEVLDPRFDGRQLFTDTRTLRAAHPELADTAQHIRLVPGTAVTAYITSLDGRLAGLGVTARRGGTDGGSDMTATLGALSALLTLVLVAVAALGVLNGVLLDTRERVREIGVHKALGMTPRQTVAMILTSVTLTGLTSGALGVPLGMALHAWILPTMAEGAGLRLPAPVLAVYHARQVLPLALGGLLIATLGASPPAVRTARTRTAEALRTE